MSDAAKHDDIEDVLSSIRRLVADGRAEPQEAEAGDADDNAAESDTGAASDIDDLPDPGDKLVLTAALRVADPDDPYRAIAPAEDLSDDEGSEFGDAGDDAEATEPEGDSAPEQELDGDSWDGAWEDAAAEAADISDDAPPDGGGDWSEEAASAEEDFAASEEYAADPEAELPPEPEHEPHMAEAEDTFPLSQIADMVQRHEGAEKLAEDAVASGQIVQFRRAGSQAEDEAAFVQDDTDDPLPEDGGEDLSPETHGDAEPVVDADVPDDHRDDAEAEEAGESADETDETNDADARGADADADADISGEFEPEHGDADWPEIGSTAAALSVAAARGVLPGAGAPTGELADYAFTTERTSRISLAGPMAAPAEQTGGEAGGDDGNDAALDGADAQPQADGGAGASFADDGFDAEADFGADDDMLDEEALRDLIRQVVREELQGALGQRITRNVRKMVRREIRLALAAETLE